jgi:aspartate/methionine/tyrosine aminotransferase
MTDVRFKTQRFNDHAARTYGRLEDTTLRRTGLERVLQEATSRNLSVLEGRIPQGDFEKFKAGAAPEAVWKEVKKRGLEGQPGAKPVINMSLGNPSAYDYEPNRDLYSCLAEIAQDSADIQRSSGYTASPGLPSLVSKLRYANFFNPQSVLNDPEAYKDVRVYITTGSSVGVELAMGPAILTKGDTLLVHDWTYIIHLAAAYQRDAHVESYDLRLDGRPDEESLEKALFNRQSGDRTVQTVVFTPIGNPIGSAMTRENIVNHLRIIERAIENEGRPIITMVDVAYEPFRRDGMPLDPILIAKEEGIKVPLVVLDTTSKGYGVCGWRMGKLGILWPDGVFDDAKADFFKALENSVLPKLGIVGVPMQMAFDRFFDRLASDPQMMKRTERFFRERRERINNNLLFMAHELQKMPGVYLSKYYDCAGTNGGLAPDTLSSFYLLFGLTRLSERYGSGFNQAVAFGEFALDTQDVAIINCVPGQSFLPKKRVSEHPALIRVTGLTNEEETASFLKSVEAFARHLG